MAYRFSPCRNERQLEEYALYMLDHRFELHPAFAADRFIHFIDEQFRHGESVLVRTAAGATVGALGFVYGTPENRFEDKHTVRIEMVYIEPTYRGTRLFARGLLWLADYLARHAPQTECVQFYCESEPARKGRLFRKIADLVVTEPTKFGLEDQFATTIERLRQAAAPRKERR